jgi:uncharacterized cupredoxin-like copper-binding protein
MPIPSIVATFITAALTASSAGGGIGLEAPVSKKDTSRGATGLAVAGPRAEPAPTTTRRINVAMEDHKFSPNVLDVRVGDTVTFVFTNFGRVLHDAFIGDKAAQQQHEKEMREAASEGHGHDHAHEGGATVPPGESGTLQYTFERAGTLEIGCHQPGHYEAGMIAILNVKPA